MAAQYSAYGASLNAVHSMSGPALRGGKRVRYSAMVIALVASLTEKTSQLLSSSFPVERLTGRLLQKHPAWQYA